MKTARPAALETKASQYIDQVSWAVTSLNLCQPMHLRPGKFNLHNLIVALGLFNEMTNMKCQQCQWFFSFGQLTTSNWTEIRKILFSDFFSSEHWVLCFLRPLPMTNLECWVLDNGLIWSFIMELILHSCITLVQIQVWTIIASRETLSDGCLLLRRLRKEWGKA